MSISYSRCGTKIDTDVVCRSVLDRLFADQGGELRGEPELDREQPASLVISDWTITETVAALSRQLRMNRLTVEEHAAAVLLLLKRNYVQQLDVLPVRRADFRIASRFAERANTGLPASHALHLAYGAGAALATRDEQQARAGATLGVSTRLLD